MLNTPAHLGRRRAHGLGHGRRRSSRGSLQAQRHGHARRRVEARHPLRDTRHVDAHRDDDARRHRDAAAELPARTSTRREQKAAAASSPSRTSTASTSRASGQRPRQDARRRRRPQAAGRTTGGSAIASRAWTSPRRDARPRQVWTIFVAETDAPRPHRSRGETSPPDRDLITRSKITASERRAAKSCRRPGHRRRVRRSVTIAATARRGRP